VHADEKLTAFVELESAICACDELGVDRLGDFSRLKDRQTDLNQAEDSSPRSVSRLVWTRNREIDLSED